VLDPDDERLKITLRGTWRDAEARPETAAVWRNDFF
jgi:hypothetical protein